MPDDSFAGTQLGYLLPAAVDVLFPIGELFTELIATAFDAPAHHPRTLLMATKASSGVWSTVVMAV
jgi:hypothetical protein